MMCEIRLSRMKMSVLKCTLCLLLVFVLTGCGTILRITEGRRENFSGEPTYFTSTGYTFGMLMVFPPIVIPDLPFSLATDTVCLPFEVGIDLYRNHRKNVDRQFWETYFANGQSLSTPEEGRRHLSDRIVILTHLEKPLPKHQIIDLINIGLADYVVDYQTLDKELFELCLGDISKGIPDNAIAAKIAETKRTSPELLEILIRGRAALPEVIKNPNTTSQMLHEISEITESLIDETGHTDAYDNRRRSVNLISRIHKAFRPTDEHDNRRRGVNLISKIREALAENPKTPQADLELLYPSDSDQVIINLTRNPNTSDALLCRIFADPKSYEYKKRDISINMASRASVPAYIQEFILSYNDDYHDMVKALLIQNKAILPEIRSALIEPKLISEFCRQRLLSPEQVRQLLDEAPADLRAVMENDQEIMSYIGKAKK